MYTIQDIKKMIRCWCLLLINMSNWKFWFDLFRNRWRDILRLKEKNLWMKTWRFVFYGIRLEDRSETVEMRMETQSCLVDDLLLTNIPCTVYTLRISLNFIRHSCHPSRSGPPLTSLSSSPSGPLTSSEATTPTSTRRRRWQSSRAPWWPDRTKSPARSWLSCRRSRIRHGRIPSPERWLWRKRGGRPMRWGWWSARFALLESFGGSVSSWRCCLAERLYLGADGQDTNQLAVPERVPSGLKSVPDEWWVMNKM